MGETVGEGMTMLRRTLAVGLAVFGAYYTIIGAITLLNLSAVTHRWIELSGDVDFRSDFKIFQVMIGAGAAMVTLLGIVTVLRAVRMLLGHQVRWGVVAVAAPLLHVPWLMYRAIGTGAPVFPALRLFATRSVVVCAAYALAWVVTRLSVARPSSGRLARS
jgi:hypothetical protein